MVTTGKKKMKAVLKADPYSEMDGKVSKWVKSIPLFVKTFKPITVSQDIELDPRKWSAGKLTKALEALVRYELKIFAQQGAEWYKKYQKKKFVAQAEAEKNYPAAYKKLVKEIEKKCSLALDELEADKGDNKKALRDGKAAMRRVSTLDLTDIFSDPRDYTISAFAQLADELKKADGNDKITEQAFRTAALQVDDARHVFNNDCKDTEAALKFLMKMAQDTKRNKDANQLLIDFADKTDSYKKTFEELVKKLEAFEVDIDDAANDIKRRKMDAALAKAKSAQFKKYRNLDKSAKAVITALKSLKPDFDKLEKELK